MEEQGIRLGLMTCKTRNKLPKVAYFDLAIYVQMPAICYMYKIT
jgi:hypothetical protein